MQLLLNVSKCIAYLLDQPDVMTFTAVEVYTIQLAKIALITINCNLKIVPKMVHYEPLSPSETRSPRHVSLIVSGVVELYIIIIYLAPFR